MYGEAASALFRALGSPVRVRVVTALDEHGRLCVHELVELLDLPQPLVSQHLRVLRGADVVRGTRRGKEIAYEIADQHVAHIVRDAVRHTSEPPARAADDAATDDAATDDAATDDAPVAS
jgi:DNA-binding transcriptional ArsR family regulator